MIKKIKNTIWEFNEKKWMDKLRKRNQNYNLTLIANNCVGGIIYHNLGLQFLSPTINLYISGSDYLNFVKNLRFYSNCELVEIETDNPYPVGKIISNNDAFSDVIVYFQHYPSFDYAKKKWIERFERVNYENIIYVWEFYDDIYDIKLLEEFDRLPIKKIAILHKNIATIKNKLVVSCYHNGKPTAKLFMRRGISGKRFLDEIDYVKFINSSVN